MAELAFGTALRGMMIARGCSLMLFLTFIACTSRQINAMLAEQGNLYSIFASTPGEGSPFWHFLTASLKVLGVRMIVFQNSQHICDTSQTATILGRNSSVWKLPFRCWAPFVVGD